MSLFSAFRKPAWQSGNPSKRLAAVSGSDDPQLRAALPSLATDDADADVRREALRRCNDPSLFARAMERDGDAALRSWARERWLAALVDRSSGNDDASLGRLSADELEQLAVKTADPAARGRLLQRINRAGFLADRALADPDAGIRLALLERIDVIATLDRIADKARRFDKRLSRSARERADALRLAAGDVGIQARRAEALCLGLEQLMREPVGLDERRQRLLAHEADWRALDADALSDTLHARFAGAREVIQAQLEPPAPAPAALVVEEVAVPPAPPSLEEIAAQTRLQAELAMLAEQKARESAEAQAEADARRQQDARQRAEQQAVLEQLAGALDDGDLARAAESLGRLQPALLSSADQQRWQTLQPRLKELQAWQRWAGSSVRQRLCEEVEAMEGSGLHPDALASRIRELQQQWRQVQADGPSDGLERRFHAACTRVLKPARGFFDKRDALRAAYRQQVDGFLATAEPALSAIDPAEVDIEALLTLQQQATGQLRDLDRLAPADRRTYADRLRALLDRIRPTLEARFTAIEDEREQLIEAAGRLANETDGKRVGQEARNLNQRWQALGKGRRGRDQQQWRRFRGALDQAFAQLDAARRETAAAADARRQEAEGLIARIEALAAIEGDALQAAATQLRELREQWQTLATRDPLLTERYDQALTRHRLTGERHKAAQRRDQWLALVADAPVADTGSDDARAQALALVFEAESLVGIDAPDGERDTRRQWQLQRLQQHLGGGAASVELGELLVRWRALPGLDAADRSRFAERLSRVVERSG